MVEMRISIAEILVNTLLPLVGGIAMSFALVNKLELSKWWTLAYVFPGALLTSLGIALLFGLVVKPLSRITGGRGSDKSGTLFRLTSSQNEFCRWMFCEMACGGILGVWIVCTGLIAFLGGLLAAAESVLVYIVTLILVGIADYLTSE